MKIYLDCIPCFFRQALEAARLAGASKNTQKTILNELAKIIPDLLLTSSPPEMGRSIYGLVGRYTNKKDPFKGMKIKSNKLALKIYKRLKKKVFNSNDRLLTAVKLAIVGNIIDYGTKNSLDIDKEMKKILSKRNISISKRNDKLFHYINFKRELKEAKTILYLADNAGEVVFDRILVEEIKKLYKDKQVIYAVKENPIINDALTEDAYQCGIDKIAKVVSNGSDIPGTKLSLCTKKFVKIYKDADMTISKGQGNSESLSDAKKTIFFLFMAKCSVVARDVGGKVGDIVLLYNLKKE